MDMLEFEHCGILALTRVTRNFSFYFLLESTFVWIPQELLHKLLSREGVEGGEKGLGEAVSGSVGSWGDLEWSNGVT